MPLPEPISTGCSQQEATTVILPWNPKAPEWKSPAHTSTHPEPLSLQYGKAKIKARTYGNISKDCVIADLLPGGFEQSENLVNGNDEVMFTDKREDRTLIFATIGSSFTYTYKIRAVNRGTFIVPSSSCEAMYDRTRRARTAAGTITVK